jgi:hypothetical protein
VQSRTHASAKCATLLISLIAAQLSVAVNAYGFSCGAIDNVTLNAEQAQLIKVFKAKDDLANIAKIAIIFGPSLDCITSSTPADCPFSVATADWDKMADAPGNLDKIGAAANAEDIELYLIGHQTIDPRARKFFECLDKYYSEIKSR